MNQFLDYFSILGTTVGLTYLLILTLLEIVLGIDNIIFISIITDNLPKNQQKKARLIGLSLALIIRIIMLSLVSGMPNFYILREEPINPRIAYYFIDMGKVRTKLEGFLIQSFMMELVGLSKLQSIAPKQLKL